LQCNDASSFVLLQCSDANGLLYCTMVQWCEYTFLLCWNTMMWMVSLYCKMQYGANSFDVLQNTMMWILLLYCNAAMRTVLLYNTELQWRKKFCCVYSNAIIRTGSMVLVLQRNDANSLVVLQCNGANGFIVLQCNNANSFIVIRLQWREQFYCVTTQKHANDFVVLQCNDANIVLLCFAIQNDVNSFIVLEKRQRCGNTVLFHCNAMMRIVLLCSNAMMRIVLLYCNARMQTVQFIAMQGCKTFIV
jgi:hypothetical protein